MHSFWGPEDEEKDNNWLDEDPVTDDEEEIDFSSEESSEIQ